MSSVLKAPSIKEVLARDNRIVALNPRADFVLEVTYADGETYSIGYADKIQSSDWMRPLRDITVFKAVKIGEGGRSIEWPNGYDNCADALRWDGELARRGLSRADVGDE